MSARSDLAVVVFAHGSRDPLWRTPVEAVATRIAQRAPGAWVGCAYLELCPPTLPEAVASALAAGARRVRVLPLFFGMGKHAREDLPALMSELQALHTEARLELMRPAGEDERLTALLADLALEDRP